MAKEVLEKSEKKDNPENKAGRVAQSKAGKTRLTDRKEFEIIKDNKHFKKGQKVKLTAPTEHLFREIGLIK